MNSVGRGTPAQNGKRLQSGTGECVCVGVPRFVVQVPRVGALSVIAFLAALRRSAHTRLCRSPSWCHQSTEEEPSARHPGQQSLMKVSEQAAGHNSKPVPKIQTLRVREWWFRRLPPAASSDEQGVAKALISPTPYPHRTPINGTLFWKEFCSEGAEPPPPPSP